MPRARILIEGRPGTGKTTCARRIVNVLTHAGKQVAGFTTEEIREKGRRVGFEIEAIGGPTGILAHIDFSGPVRVGKYGVDLEIADRVHN